MHAAHRFDEHRKVQHATAEHLPGVHAVGRLDAEGHVALQLLLEPGGQVLNLALFFIWELILANLRVAYDVVTPGHHMQPGVIGIPLAARTDLEITVLSSMISLTPGTLSLDVSADRKMLYIHAMYLDDVEAARRKIKDGFERRVLEVLR